jgi:hypothetical protein
MIWADNTDSADGSGLTTLFATSRLGPRWVMRKCAVLFGAAAAEALGIERGIMNRRINVGVSTNWCADCSWE